MSRNTDFTKAAATFIAKYIDTMNRLKVIHLDDELLSEELQLGKLLHDATMNSNGAYVYADYLEEMRDPDPNAMTMAEFVGEPVDPMLKNQYSGDSTYESVLRELKQNGYAIDSDALIDFGLDANQMVAMRKQADQLIEPEIEIEHLPKPKPWEKIFFSHHFLDHKIELIKDKEKQFNLVLSVHDKLGGTAAVEFDFLENSVIVAANSEQCEWIKDQIPFDCIYNNYGPDSDLTFEKAAGNAEAILNALARIEVNGEKLISHTEKHVFVEQFRENCPPHLQRTK